MCTELTSIFDENDIKMTEPKIKKTSLTVEERCNILKQLQDGASPSEVANKFNVTRQAIAMIKKRKDCLENARKVLHSCDGNFQKKRYRATEETLLEKKLFEWFRQQRSMGLAVSGPILKKQALIYNKRLGGKENFAASDGWLDRFKKRHGLKQRNIHGEKLSANLDGSEEFKLQLKNIMQVIGIDLDCVYNCDETGLYWKAEPSKTLVCRNEKSAEGRKKSKNRLSVLLCCNASGTHKLPLLVIGKYAQPRCLKNIQHTPVHYMNQKNAWMSSDLMMKWYQSIFLPEVTKKHNLDKNEDKKIMLIMDNAPCHPSEEILNELSNNCSVLYLPPNVTSLIQPLDQGIIEKFKKCYKNYFSERLLIEDEMQNSQDVLRSFNLLDCFNLCKLAWDQITSQNIRNCWKNLIPLEDNDSSSDIEVIDAQDFHNILTKIPKYQDLSIENVKAWLDIDASEIGWQPRSDENILTGRYPDDDTDEVEELDDIVSYNDQNSSPSDSILDDSCPTFIEAFQGINTFLEWYQKKGKSPDLYITCFQRAHEELKEFFIAKKQHQSEG